MLPQRTLHTAMGHTALGHTALGINRPPSQGISIDKVRGLIGLCALLGLIARWRGSAPG